MAASKWLPTAQTSVAETAATPESLSARPLLSVAAGTALQPVPFQFSTRGWYTLLLVSRLYPTAQAFAGERSATAFRMFTLPNGFGVGTTAQLLPFQCSAREKYVELVLFPS
jgi:hypothetical protein